MERASAYCTLHRKCCPGFCYCSRHHHHICVELSGDTERCANDSNRREGHGIDLSAILAYARDELESHVIIVLDCCYGGLPLPSPGKFTCPSDKVVELVAAGEGVVSGLYGDFSWLVADVFEQADGEDSYRHP